jgi:hypothetical protein
VAEDPALTVLHGRHDFAAALRSLQSRHDAFRARVFGSAVPGLLEGST